MWLWRQLRRRKKSELVQVIISDGMIRFCRDIKFKLLDFLGPKEAKIKRLICTNNIAVGTHCMWWMSCWKSLLIDSDRLYESAPGDSTHICAGKPEELMVVRFRSWVTAISSCDRRDLPLKLCGLTLACHAAAIVSVLQLWHCWTYVTVLSLPASTSVFQNVSLVSRL